MKTMKRTIMAFAAIVMMSTGNAIAQKTGIYQSEENGICVCVPDETTVMKDDETILHLQSEELVFSAHPMFAENMTETDVTNLLQKTAESVGLDISKMEGEDYESNTLKGSFFYGTTNGVHFAEGIAAVKNNDNVIFLFTITFSDKAIPAFKELIPSIEFNASAIK